MSEQALDPKDSPESALECRESEYKADDVYIVQTTVTEDKAAEIARKLLELSLAACVQSLESESFYCWEGEIKQERERLLIIKTSRSRFSSLVKELEKIHPYDVPEIIAYGPEFVSHSYKGWVIEQTET